ncbi:MAG: CaiB/BaiF CoA transferase family protein [Sulfitobacter sp.]
MSERPAHGPLAGLRIVEMAGLGPTPHAAMLLADLGAEVLRIERPNAPQLIPQDPDFLNRSRQFCALDLKSAQGQQTALDLIASADALIEGMRPGVMEKLGLGPEACHARNPALVYGRMTGWGQTGPLAARAGHDINYIALTGALHAMGGDAPAVPLNLVGDFGGGSLYLVVGMLSALLHARRTGQGQVVDAAIVDGTLNLMTIIYSMQNSGLWHDRRAANLLDGGAPFYGVYTCKCGGHIALGALEPQFFAALVQGLGLEDLPPQHDQSRWGEMRAAFTARIVQKTRDAWAEVFAGTDACVTPVLSMEEARRDPHITARGGFIGAQPAPAPRLSATPGRIAHDALAQPQDAQAILARWRR